MRADIHDGREHALQSEAGYIDARPHQPKPSKPLAPHGRTIHWGQNPNPPFSGLCQLWPAADITPNPASSAPCRFCCKSPFALVIKISFGCTRDFRVKMWGTSSPDDKLTDGLRNAIEGTRISGRRWSFLTAEKLAPGDLGLLQQYLPITDFGRLRGPITPL